MRRLFRRAPKPPSVAELERRHGTGLAWGVTAAGEAVLATKEALVVGPLVVPWHEIDKAAWAPPVFSIRHRANGAPQELRLVCEHIGALPLVVRERVTRSVVVSQRVELGDDGTGAIVAGRRTADGRVRWTVVFDPGVDPADPRMRAAARDALDALRRSYGA